MRVHGVDMSASERASELYIECTSVSECVRRCRHVSVCVCVCKQINLQCMNSSTCVVGLHVGCVHICARECKS